LGNAYREGVYALSFKGDLLAFTNALWTQFELVNHTKEDGLVNAQVRLLNQASVNDLLSAVLPAVEVQSLNEVMPSMEEIFIKVVNRNKEGNE